jgi:hypothetical protein
MAAKDKANYNNIIKLHRASTFISLHFVRLTRYNYVNVNGEILRADRVLEMLATTPFKIFILFYMDLKLGLQSTGL